MLNDKFQGQIGRLHYQNQVIDHKILDIEFASL